MRDISKRILRALGDGKAVSIREVKCRLVAGGVPRERVSKMGGYEFTSLKRAGLIDNPQRGEYKITEVGRMSCADVPARKP